MATRRIGSVTLGGSLVVFGILFSGAYLLGWPALWADPAVLAVAADLSGSGNTSEPAAVGNQMGL